MSGNSYRKFKNQTIRLHGWDYGSNGSYFVTINTKEGEHFFGQIKNKRVNLTDAGRTALHFWKKIPLVFPYAKIGAFIIMPNHLHGIIIIDKQHYSDKNAIDRLPKTNQNKIPGGITGSKNPMLNDNLSRIIRWYKGRVTFEIHKFNTDFTWQPRFYDRIIRNRKSYFAVTRYIINNPARWENDHGPS